MISPISPVCAIPWACSVRVVWRNPASPKSCEWLLAVFNTVTSNRPVDFNLSQVTPGYSRGGIFWMHGFQIGAGFVF